jgi:hypothetical protein
MILGGIIGQFGFDNKEISNFSMYGTHTRCCLTLPLRCCLPLLQCPSLHSYLFSPATLHCNAFRCACCCLPLLHHSTPMPVPDLNLFSPVTLCCNALRSAWGAAVCIVEWPRSARAKGYTIPRMYQGVIVRVLENLGKFWKNLYFRSCLYIG